MNIRLIFFVTTISTISIASATCYRGSDGYFRCKEKGKKEYRLSDIEDYKTKRESYDVYQHNPYEPSFYSIRAHQDGTHNANGNR